jgi:hypothetical protein
MIMRNHITKGELTTLNSLFRNRKIEKDGQKQLDEFWQLLSEKYHFHSDHTLIHDETGEIIDNCTDR